MSTPPQIETLLVLLDPIPDPRKPRGLRHPLTSILAISLLAMICNADSGEEIEEFGEANEEWLRSFLSLPHGIPSQDTILRVFAALDPVAFRDFFQTWVSRLVHGISGDQIAVDGKTLRHSYDTASGSKAIHMVSAWLCETGLVFGQVRTSEKSNEITAIPELLALLDIRDMSVSIDAMGCQVAIAEQIVEAGAHYVLAVKDNQPTLHLDIVGFFEDAERPNRARWEVSAPPLDVFEHVDAGHGRIEERRCVLSRDLSWIQHDEKWAGLSVIAMVESTRTDAQTDESSTERRYYIGSHPELSAESLAKQIRQHWGIENSLHWVLDMSFSEDACRIRKGHAAENFGMIRHVALNLLRQAPGKKKSIKLRRKRCCWDRNYLLAVLGQSSVS